MTIACTENVVFRLEVQICILVNYSKKKTCYDAYFFQFVYILLANENDIQLNHISFSLKDRNNRQKLHFYHACCKTTATNQHILSMKDMCVLFAITYET